MSTSTRVLCLLPALWPAITLGEPSAPAGQSCPAPSGKSTIPAQMASIPPGEKTRSLILEARDDDGKPISNQKEIMEWIRLRLELAEKQPDSITILPEGSYGVRVQLRGEAMQQADDLESYLLNNETFQILPVHPHNDLLLADRDPETGIVQNIPDNAQIMLHVDPIHHQASEIIVQTDRCVIDYRDNKRYFQSFVVRHWLMENTPPKSLGEHNYANPIITKHNIEKAFVDEHDPSRIHITFTSTGQLKLQQYMSTMKPGHDRLAIVFDNCIVATPNLPGKPDTELSFALDTPQQAAQTVQWLSSKNIHLVRADHQKHSLPTSTAE